VRRCQRCLQHQVSLPPCKWPSPLGGEFISIHNTHCLTGCSSSNMTMQARRIQSCIEHGICCVLNRKMVAVLVSMLEKSQTPYTHLAFWCVTEWSHRTKLEETTYTMQMQTDSSWMMQNAIVVSILSVFGNGLIFSQLTNTKSTLDIHHKCSLISFSHCLPDLLQTHSVNFR